ncbi:MAG: S-layer homology domain-containing protein [Thermoanaerobaculia bacterium]
MRAKAMCILTTGLAALLALPPPTRALDATDERIPLTDRALLERLGFEPDAPNVYATPRALANLLMSPAERAAAAQAQLAPDGAAEQGTPVDGSYGTSTQGFTFVPAIAMQPRSSATEHQILNGTERVCSSGPPFFDAPFETLPHGAQFEVLVGKAYDTSVENIDWSLFRVCAPPSGAMETTVLESFGADWSTGYSGFGIGVDEVIDTQDCGYYARVRLGDAGSSCLGNELRVLMVQAVWRRQVSPAPANATFDDVPTTHLFFRHIEALAASGITGGCGGNNYCPNAPLTRGQMAAFLAKALGLHWDDISQ